jgi:hypothetical protein
MRIKRMRMAFPLIAALAIAGAAQAQKEDHSKSNQGKRPDNYASQSLPGKSPQGQANGHYENDKAHAYGHDKSDKGLNKISDKGLEKALKAYEDAWKYHDKRTSYDSDWDNLNGDVLYKALDAYKQAWVAALQNGNIVTSDSLDFADLREFITDEESDISSHLRTVEHLKGVIRTLVSIVSNLENADEGRADLEARIESFYEDGKNVLRQFGEKASTSRAEAALDKAYKYALKKAKGAPVQVARSTKGVEKVKGKGTAEIDTHSVCKVVTSKDPRPMFIAARTKEEWASGERSFLKNLPKGVTVTDCGVSSTPNGEVKRVNRRDYPESAIRREPKRDDDRNNRVVDTTTGRYVDDDKPKYRSNARQADEDGDGRVSSGPGGWRDD